MTTKQTHILMIEDNPGDAGLISEMLPERGLPSFSLAHTDKLSSGLDCLSQNTYDVILLDIGLPDSNGLNSISEIKKMAPRTPIVMLTGHDDEDTAISALQLGAQDYLVKGRIESSLLVRSLRYAIERKQIEEELRKHREFLMELVEERTSELQKSNEDLAREILERKLAEEETIRAGHLAALGELAAGVAHEINNPINGIINFAQILLNKHDAGSEDYDIANRIIKEGVRIATIVKNLLLFSRDRKEDKGPVHIDLIMPETLLLTETQLRKDGVDLRVNIPQDLPEIFAHPQQIQQVVLNIISNARYALNQKYPKAHEGKVLEIAGEKISIDNSPYLRMTFHDRGTGIPSDIIDKVMNPFFSTKPVDKGTGLGLSISHGIIRDHGGRIKLESVAGEFTKVIIDLPAA